MFINCHQKLHFQKHRCCGNIQGPPQIMTIMTDTNRYHFISRTTIYGYEALMVVIVDAYIWWHSLTITILYFGEGKKISPKLIGDGQKSL